MRWSQRTRRLFTRLQSECRTIRPSLVDLRETSSLPVPVRRWFELSLRDGQPMIQRVFLRQEGEIDLAGATPRWCRFRARQSVVLGRPGFAWSARVSIVPGGWVGVHDSYVGGNGALRAALLGWLTVADSSASRGTDRDEWLRFVAEAPWYPTALLPSQGAHWTAIDDHSARVTLRDGSLEADLVFRFGEAGFVDTVSADARGRMVGKDTVPTKWLGRFWDHRERSGMRVPMAAEVAWVIDGEVKPYWRGRVLEICHEPDPEQGEN
ncbi:MAG: DUF6544 family protein [Planctomycetota bacterium]